MEAITQSLEEAIQQAGATASTIIFLLIALSIIPYVLFGIGLNSVAGRLGLRNKWMAWVPIARKHLLAEVADIRRAQVRKTKKLETQYEIITALFAACIFMIPKTNNLIIPIILAVLFVLLSYNQIFSYYYFYRLCDRENSTIYFIIGLMVSPLNSIFVYHCR